MPVPLLIPLAVAGVVAVAGAVTYLVTHRDAGLDPSPAAPGTPQVDARVPVGLWPPDGREPVVEAGLAGWRRMAAHLYHRDTTIDDAARARAVVLATFARRAADARRSVAFEASVLQGGYDAAVVAAAWLLPQRAGAGAAADRAAYAAFGIGRETLAILEAAEQLDADTGRLAPEWGRLVGLDPAHPDFTAIDATALDAGDRARLGALVIDAATHRIHARA